MPISEARGGGAFFEGVAEQGPGEADRYGAVFLQKTSQACNDPALFQ